MVIWHSSEHTHLYQIPDCDVVTIGENCTDNDSGGKLKSVKFYI